MSQERDDGGTFEEQEREDISAVPAGESAGGDHAGESHRMVTSPLLASVFTCEIGSEGLLKGMVCGMGKCMKLLQDKENRPQGHCGLPNGLAGPVSWVQEVFSLNDKYVD